MIIVGAVMSKAVVDLMAGFVNQAAHIDRVVEGGPAA